MSNTIPVNTTYEPFSKEPEYIEANEGFVSSRNFEAVDQFLDLACGNGLISGLLLRAKPSAFLNGIDYDPVQIDLAEEHLSNLGHVVTRGEKVATELINGKPVVTLCVCSADELPFPDEVFDCVTIGNAIHMLPDKDKLLAEVRRVLKADGKFGFNSSFYAGTYGAGTEEHFFLWVGEADAYIRQLNKQRQQEGSPVIRRKRGGTRAAFQNKWLSEKEWIQRLEAHGFRIDSRNERVVMLNERCLRAVGAYGGLAEVLLSGYPVEVASEALQATAKRSLELAGQSALARNYLELWSTKKA